MVLGENRSDAVTRGTIGNRDSNLLACNDFRTLTAKEALDGWHDKENDRGKREHRQHNADDHGNRRTLLLSTATSMRVVARAGRRSNAMRTASVMRMRLGGLRSLGRYLLLKAGAACRLGRTSRRLLSRMRSRMLNRTSRRLLTRPLNRLGRTREGLHRARGRLSCALRRLCRTLARLGRARRRLLCTIRLARIGSTRHAKPPRFYDRATSAKTGWRQPCRSCPSSAFR